MRHKRRTAGICTSMMVVGGLLAACASTGPQSGVDHAQSETIVSERIGTVPDIAAMVPRHIRVDNVLRVGTVSGYAPAVYRDETSGKLRGYDVDMVRAIATVMGLEEVDIRPVDFKDLLDGLGFEYDVAVAGIAVSEPRLTEANFATYAEVGSLFAVKATDAATFKPESLCGATIGALSESLQYDYLVLVSQRCQDAGSPPLTVVTAANQNELITKLLDSKVSAVLGGMETINHAVEDSSGDLVATGEVVAPQVQGVAIAKSDSQLTVTVQAALQYLMDNGFLKEIFDKYKASGILLDISVINPAVD